MAADLTAAEFSKHINTPFVVALGPDAQVDLDLIEVKNYAGNPGDQDGMERFSLFFKGPTQPILPQRLYSLDHDVMGVIDIFLVALAPQADGARYEAVFNYFKNS